VETEFWLYLSKVSEQALTRFTRTFEQKHNLEIVVNRVNGKDKFFKQEGNVIVSELCELPYWQLVLLTPLESVAFETYCFYIAQGWNACLFDPKAKAIFVGFQQGLLARKVAHLWYKKGRSDKVYHIYLAYEPNTKSYAVIRRYGKRNGVLWQMEKSYDSHQEEAEEEWQKIFEQKIKNGYEQRKTLRAVQLELAG